MFAGPSKATKTVKDVFPDQGNMATDGGHIPRTTREKPLPMKSRAVCQQCGCEHYQALLDNPRSRQWSDEHGVSEKTVWTGADKHGQDFAIDAGFSAIPFCDDCPCALDHLMAVQTYMEHLPVGGKRTIPKVTQGPVSAPRE